MHNQTYPSNAWANLQSETQQHSQLHLHQRPEPAPALAKHHSYLMPAISLQREVVVGCRLAKPTTYYLSGLDASRRSQRLPPQSESTAKSPTVPPNLPYAAAPKPQPLITLGPDACQSTRLSSYRTTPGPAVDLRWGWGKNTHVKQGAWGSRGPAGAAGAHVWGGLYCAGRLLQ